jgi:hypothetical protein
MAHAFARQDSDAGITPGRRLLRYMVNEQFHDKNLTSYKTSQAFLATPKPVE